MELNADQKAWKIYEKMMEGDKFSEWLGLELEEIREGYCRLHYTLRPEMVNGFETAHGGILFAASDSAFAFACNSHGVASVALDVTINYLRPGKINDLLTVEAKMVNLGNKTGVYEIRTTNQHGDLVCLFRGTSYRNHKPEIQFLKDEE